MNDSIRWTALKLTIFTIVTIIVTTWLAAIIGNLRFFSSPYEIKAVFTDATGVLNGDVVKAAGVTVGRVQSIAISDGLAEVTMAIEEDIELPGGLGAEIRFRNLIGQRMITLVQPDVAAGRTEPGEVIPVGRTEPAFDLTALFNGLRPLIRSTDPADINLVSRELVAALQGRSGNVEGFLSNVADITEVLASKDAEIGTLLDGMNVVTEDLAGRDQQLQTTIAAMGSFFSDVAASKEDLKGALVTLDDAATRFGRIIADNDRAIEGELADLATIFAAVDDRRAQLRKVIRSLPGFLIGVERVTTYGQWTNVHLIDVCKDDFGTCGTRWMP